MDILTDKYLPKEDVLNIAYAIPPEDIVKFCATNKYTLSLCKNDDFWRGYINKNQKKYNKILITFAIMGETYLWKRLWTNSVKYDVISERKMIIRCFRQAVLNGNDDTANIIYKYVKRQNNKEALKLEVLLEDAIIKNDFKLSKILLIEYAKKNKTAYRINAVLAHASNLNIVNYIKEIHDKENMNLMCVLRLVFEDSIKIGNLPLVAEMLQTHPTYNNMSAEFLIKTPNYDIFKLILSFRINFWRDLSTRINEEEIDDPDDQLINSIMITNKNITFDLIEHLPKYARYILIGSSMAFKIDQYFKILEKYDITLTQYEYDRILTDLSDWGEDYKVYLVEKKFSHLKNR